MEANLNQNWSLRHWQCWGRHISWSSNVFTPSSWRLHYSNPETSTYDHHHWRRSWMPIESHGQQWSSCFPIQNGLWMMCRMRWHFAVRCFTRHWPQGPNLCRTPGLTSQSTSRSFPNRFPRSQSRSQKHPLRISLLPPQGRIPNGMTLGWKNSATARASASDITLASVSQANSVGMRTSAQWQKRMGKLAVDSIRPPGTKSRHTDLAHTIQRKMHAIQRSFLQNFFPRLWFQSPHLCRAHVLKAENFHRRVQPDFFLTFFRVPQCQWA